ncbi:TauD/TfdA family dioxygenase [Yinghuangia aomiensis]
MIAEAKAALAKTGIIRVSEFPTSVPEYRRFLESFGETVSYYGDDSGTHPDDNAIWRIKYDPASALLGEAHAVAGPLTPHSSQSLRDPRPNFFSMLMVNAGWQGRAFGRNGESVLSSWRSAFESMRTELGSDFDPIRQTLLDAVEYPDGSWRPVAYHLESARSEDDLGVRLKSDHLRFLQTTSPGSPATRAVEALSAAAARTAVRVPLRSGDLILLDNNRWGHGRESVVGHEKRRDGSLRLNPRELWSVTID